MSFDDVLAACRGRRFELDERGAQALWFAFDPGAADLAFTPADLRVRMEHHHDLVYPIAIGPGVISFLLQGVPAVDAAAIRTRIAQITVHAGRMPTWTCPARHVLVEPSAARVDVRVRDSAAALDEALPDLAVPVLLALAHACPHCHRVPAQYRLLSGGSLVCLACGASSERPA